MSFSDDIKEKLSQFDQETSQLLRELIDRQTHEIEFFERNWLYKYQDLYNNYFTDEAIMAIRDVDERNELQYQKTKFENSFKRHLNSLKRKHKKEYESFTQKRLKERSILFSTDKNATILSYRLNLPLLPQFNTSKFNKLINNSNISNQENTEKIKKKKKVRKFRTNHKIDNNFDNNQFGDNEHTVNSLSLSQLSSNQNFLNTDQTPGSNSKRQSSNSFQKGNSSFLSSRTRFIPNSTQKNYLTEKEKSSTKQKNDNQDDFDVLDVESLDKHFRKRDKKRKEIERERQNRFEEKFSYQISSKDVSNYKRKNITDKRIIDKIQNKSKSKFSSFNIIETENNNQSQTESNPEIIEPKQKNKKIDSLETKKIEEEEILIAPINLLDSVQLVSDSSSDSFESKIPTNQISLDYSYESYYSEYEVEEKIYLCPTNKIKKKSNT